MIGARKINAATLIMILVFTIFIPACAMAAPANPPMSVCDELEGMPKYQVKRFQAMAAISPANTTHRSMAPVLTVFEMVSAMFSSKSQNARKLKNAAHITACTGVNTLVLTMVAMELAAS